MTPLRRQMIEDMTARGFSQATHASYWIASDGRFPTAVRVPTCRRCVKGSASK
jgi:hypothetical protein